MKFFFAYLGPLTELFDYELNDPASVLVLRDGEYLLGILQQVVDQKAPQLRRVDHHHLQLTYTLLSFIHCFKTTF